MPTVRPFRALRYSSEDVPDLAAVVAPPYDIVSPERRRQLVARDPRNVVRLDLPSPEPGDAPDEPEQPYRRASRLLSAWRSDGTLRRDPRPSLYPYEQTYCLPGGREQRTRLGVFATLALEPFGADSGVRPHERTLSAPKEDRYRLLRATGVNTSPVVGLYDDPSGDAAEWLAAATAGTPPVADVTDDDGVRHRLWRVEPGAMPEIASRSPITIADGHHRYETALRYRDERRREAPPTDGPAPWDDVLALLLEPRAGPVDVLATHRVVRAIGGDGLARLDSRLRELFEVRPAAGRAELEAAFAPAAGASGGAGRFGLWTRSGGAILHVRQALAPPGGAAGHGAYGSAVAGLDVTRLGLALDLLLGIGPDEVDAGTRIAYTKDAAEAIAWVDAGHDGADAAFLLDPTPAAALLAVAAEGDVMPQKSTYIYPKALTGLVINPLE